jgi:hypothetical protein
MNCQFIERSKHDDIRKWPHSHGES